MPTARSAAFDPMTAAFLALLVVATALRIEALRLSPLNLYYEEAQYWVWSRSFDWGYFTKPPMVAWTIAATTGLFGDGEWAVRLAAPIAQSLTALSLFALGRSIYGAWAGFWAGVGWLALPGVFFSSEIISTDAMLLPFWALAMFAAWRLLQTRAYFWAVVMGAAIGLGAEGKYAMLYFPLCLGFAAQWSHPMRQALKGGRGVIAALAALSLFAPNIAWNVEHHFATAEQAAANVGLDAAPHLFNFDNLAEFVGAQMLVLGPILFLALAALLWRSARRASGLSDEDRFLLAFMLPPLVLASSIAFIARANANWAAAAYPAAIVWVVGNLLVNRGARRLLAGALGLNIVLGSVVVAGTLNPTLAVQVKGIRTATAWDDTAREIAVRAARRPSAPPFSAVMVDSRVAYFELTYYWRQARQAGAPLPPLRLWPIGGRAYDSAEQLDPMRVGDGRRVLIVHQTPKYLPFIAGDFTTFHTVEHLTIPLGGGLNRNLEISVGEGFSPAARDAAFEQRLRDAHASGAES
jgi:hypothetical protein